MRLKAACFVKRFLIVILLVTLIASVGAVPSQTALFAAFSAVCIFLVRVLWVSALKDEKTTRKQHIQVCKESISMPQTLKRAA